MTTALIAVVIVSSALLGTADQQIIDGSVSEATWSCLQAAGYHGDPTDGVEAIYAPESAVAACTAR